MTGKAGKFTATIKKYGLDILHANREGKRGGGVAIIYRKDIKVKPISASSIEYATFEYSHCIIQSMGIKIQLVCVYRRQVKSLNMFCEEFENFMESIFYQGDKTILVGDFNVWVDDANNSDTKKMLKLMNAYGLSQIIKEPTHVGDTP